MESVYNLGIVFVKGYYHTNRPKMMTGLRTEFHCHTLYSSDSLTHPADLIAACRARGLDRVVVTDHNTIIGAVAAQRLAPELVIIGEEIKTTRGEILAAFVREEVPPYLSPQEAIRRLRDQGAFISLSHPFDPLRENWMCPELEEILPLIDAIEIFNSRCLWPGANRRAREFAREYNLPGTAGSDAHAAFELGRAVVLLPQFEGPEGLRQVIRQAKFEMRRSPFGAHFASRYASLRKKIRV